ncbi:glucose 1-dehydrogenase [Actinomadura oligospora]|uniref:glucose 1-dehydrogenase n=1 Tax=Actinomadura oligospora TaxID=111804 RepID=UPI0004B89599|nr:glucose 1-dehydrogenase [Actinomadura oligospora]
MDVGEPGPAVRDDLGGKVAIVTGGARSIGAAIATELVARGARVLVLDVEEGAGKELAGRLGRRAAFVPADVADPAGRATAVRASVDTFGGVDLLVNNAVEPADGGASADTATWLRSYEVNVVAAVMMTQECRALMRRRGGGVVVNVASVSGHRAQAGRWVYNASKAALLQVTRSAARDLAEDGIRVVSVSPAWTWSRIIGAMAGGDRRAADRMAGSYQALGRVGDAEEVARAVAFLCSSDASFITGSDLAVDGGYLALGPEG